MSEFDDLAGAFAVPALMQCFGASATYERPGGESFTWNCSVSQETGADEYKPSGDMVKVLRRKIHGPTAGLTCHGVVELERRAIVRIGEIGYSIDLAESSWTESAVVLGLKREPIVEHQRLEGNAIR